MNKKNFNTGGISIYILYNAWIIFCRGSTLRSFCRVTGFGGTTQNAQNKELPKIVINQNYKIRFDTNSNSSLNWKFYPEKKHFKLKTWRST